MKLCRFQDSNGRVAPGLILSDSILFDLSPARVERLEDLLESTDLAARLEDLASQNLPRHTPGSVKFLAPVDRQEVWAAGVTYLRSKSARMEESDFSASAYDRVYDAPRPELFMKAIADKVVEPEGGVGIRQDAKWNVPEPELALVFNSRGELAGYTIGNDMSSRDIEGENLLYLPQAKMYDRSCAVGPWIVTGVSEEEARAWDIEVRIERAKEEKFSGSTKVSQIKRSFDELKEFLFRSQRFPYGVILLTGTGIVPGDDFSLQPGDIVTIRVSGIGALRKSVVTV